MKDKKSKVEKGNALDPQQILYKISKERLEIAKAIKRCIRKKFKFDNAKMVNSSFRTWNHFIYDGVIYINGKELFLDKVTMLEINEIKKRGK